MNHFKLGTVVIYLSFLMIFQVHADSYCPHTKEVVSIGKELKKSLKNLCKQGFNANQVPWLKNNFLPKIMQKDFLGVEPPQNWQLLTNSLTDACYQGQNLCLREEQEKFGKCTKENQPIVIVIFTAWYYQNCNIINKSIIKQWDSQKEAIIKLLVPPEPLPRP